MAAPKSKWYVGVFEQLESVILDSGFVLQVPAPAIVLHKHPEYPSRAGLPLRIYFRETFSDVLQEVYLSGEKGSKGIQFDIHTSCTSPPVVSILAALQRRSVANGSPSMVCLNPFLQNCSTFLYEIWVSSKSDHQALVTRRAEYFQQHGLPWYDKYPDFASIWKELKHNRHYFALKIAANLYLGEFDEALKLCEYLEELRARQMKEILESHPEYDEAGAVALLDERWISDVPSLDDVDSRFLQLARKAILAKDYQAIF